MNGDLDWILAQDEETGRFVHKPKRRPAAPRERKPPHRRPARPPRLPSSFYADALGVGLTAQEADAVRFIAVRGIVSVAELVAFLFDDPLDERGEHAKRAHAKVVLSHARAKLEDVGYTIHRPIGGGGGLKSSFFYLEPLEGANNAAA